MRNAVQKMGVLPTLSLGAGLLFIGLSTINYIVDNWWLFDVERLDLLRDTALFRADSLALMDAANPEILLAFLAAVLISITGAVMPLAFILNRRFGRHTEQADSPQSPRFMVVLRQSIWVGLWVAICTWLQMQRILNLPVAFLIGGIMVLLEVMLQVRTRTAVMTG